MTNVTTRTRHRVHCKMESIAKTIESMYNGAVIEVAASKAKVTSAGELCIVRRQLLFNKHLFASFSLKYSEKGALIE